MKRFSLIIASLAFLFVLYSPFCVAQVQNYGSITLESGATLDVNNSLLNNQVGIISNQGTLKIDSNLLNDSNATLSGSGLYQIGGNWTNLGNYIKDTSTVEFIGAKQSIINSLNTDSFYSLKINKTNALTFITGTPLVIDKRVTWDNNADNARILTTDSTYIMVLDTTINAITNYDNNNFIAGKLYKPFYTTTGTILFPVGANSTDGLKVAEFVNVQNTGGLNTIGVKFSEVLTTTVYDSFALGEGFYEGLHNAGEWQTSSFTSADTNLNFSVRLHKQYGFSNPNLYDTVNNNNNNKFGILSLENGRYTNKYINSLPALNSAGRRASDAFARRNNVRNLDTFAIGYSIDTFIDFRILFAVKALLGGALDTTTGLMRTKLASLGLIPNSASNPKVFGNARFGYNKKTLNIDSVNVMPANVVDWVLIELRRDTAASTSFDTLIAFLGADGSVLGMNGKTLQWRNPTQDPVIFIIHHRNHLPIMSNSKLVMRNFIYDYDFTTGSNKYFVKNNSIGVLDGTDNSGNKKYFMIPGDINGDKELNTSTSTAQINDAGLLRTKITTSLNNTLTGAVFMYDNYDVNLDGQVRFTGENNDRLIINRTMVKAIKNSVKGSISNQLPR